MKGLLMALVLLTAAIPITVSAAEQSTPDGWRLHYNANGVKTSMNGSDVGGGTLTLGVTLRDELRIADESDNNLYAYIRGNLSGAKVGDGSVNAALNLRAAGSSGWKTGEYNALFDSLDSSVSEDSKWDLRLYQGNIGISQIIPLTDITLGRTYVEHLTDVHIDGADLKIGTEKYFGFAYFGLPVSYYLGSIDTKALGLGLNADFDVVKVRGEFISLMGDDEENTLNPDTSLWKLRADANYALDGIIDGSIYAEGGGLEDAYVYDAGILGNLTLIDLGYSLWIKGQYDENRDGLNPVVSDYDMTVGYQSEFVQAGGRLSKAITEQIAVGIGYENRFNFSTYYGDMDYNRISGNIDLTLFEGSFISLTVDYYDVPQERQYGESKQLYAGGRVSQEVNDGLSIYGGALLTQYKYYLRDYLLPSAIYAEGNKKLNQSVYVAYLGAQCEPVKDLTVTLDLSYESSEVLKDTDEDIDGAIGLSLTANFLF
jgi:hypothetical protein